MNIEINKLTGLPELHAACNSTRKTDASPSKMTLDKIYKCKHSPIRTQTFWIKLVGIPTFVSTHLIRHKIGIEHFVESNRDDRGGSKDVGRLTPVNHSMLVNAESLMTLASKRLCYNSHLTTVGVMSRVRSAVSRVDPDLAKLMVPQCVINGFCPELKQCHVGVVAVLNSYKNNWYELERQHVIKQRHRPDDV